MQNQNVSSNLALHPDFTVQVTIGTSRGRVLSENTVNFILTFEYNTEINLASPICVEEIHIEFRSLQISL